MCDAPLPVLGASHIHLQKTVSDTILIHIFDPRSLHGLWKSIRYGVRRYPTFIVNGKTKISGWDREHLEHNLHAAGAIPQTGITAL